MSRNHSRSGVPAKQGLYDPQCEHDSRGCEVNTGDGAGILMQTPHSFLADSGDRYKCEKLFEEIVETEGRRLLGWRTVPANNKPLGNWARNNEPVIRQLFIRRDPKISDDMAFERKLYVIRKLAERGIRYSGIRGGERFYIPSLSHKTITYKGMLTPDQMGFLGPEEAVL